MKNLSATVSPFPYLKNFLIVYALFWIVSTISLMIWGYEGTFLWLNSLHTPVGDSIMPHYTHLGDGVLVGFVFCLIMLLTQRDEAIVFTVIITLVILLCLSFCLKNFVFYDWNRPPLVFDGRAIIHYITLQSEKYHTFPSGHSIAGGATFTFCAYVLGRYHSIWSMLIALVSISVCYTRVYIGVHFLGDILVGSLVGVVMAYLSLWKLYPLLKTYISRLSPPMKRLQTLLLYGLVVSILCYDIYRLYVSMYQL